MYMTIIINGQTFKAWGSTVINAIKDAMKDYNNIPNNPAWDGYPIVDGEQFNKMVFCTGYDAELQAINSRMEISRRRK